MTTTHILKTAEADIAYDVHGPLPTADGRPPLLMIGQPMDASGFSTLASHFPDRTVVTYDPRGLGRSIRKDGRVDNAPTVQADDVHAVIEALGVGPVEMFASSGGAVTALALVAAYPNDVARLVAHDPPLLNVRRCPPPNYLVSSRRSSPAITVASWAASPDTPANPKPSPADCATSLTMTTDG